jgi:hypothetical protein
MNAPTTNPIMIWAVNDGRYQGRRESVSFGSLEEIILVLGLT